MPESELIDITLSGDEWVEVLALDADEATEAGPLGRGVWMMLAHMSMRKAELIAAGLYGGDAKASDLPDRLRRIASKILVHFFGTSEEDKPEEPKGGLMSQADYLASAGTLCPYCESDDIDTDAMEPDGDGASAANTCNSCKATWKSHFGLTGYEPTNGPDIEEQD